MTVSLYTMCVRNTLSCSQYSPIIIVDDSDGVGVVTFSQSNHGTIGIEAVDVTIAALNRL